MCRLIERALLSFIAHTISTMKRSLPLLERAKQQISLSSTRDSDQKDIPVTEGIKQQLSLHSYAEVVPFYRTSHHTQVYMQMI